MASPNSNFDAIASSTLRNYLNNTFTDNVFNGLPLYAWIRKEGREETWDGGEFLVEPLMYDTNKTFAWMTDYGTVDTSPQDGLTAAQFNPKMLGGSVTYSVMEQAKNSGRQQVINLLNSKIEQAKISAQNTLNTDLYADGTGSGGNAITGFGAMIKTTGTYGNINRSTASNAFWRAVVDSTAGPLNEDDMRIQYNNQSKNVTHPTLIMTTQALYQKYESLILPAYRTENTKMGDLGFQSLSFKGVPVVYDDACPSGDLNMLNDNFLKLRPHSQHNGVWTDKREPVNQFVFSMLYRWIGQLTCSNCRFQGKLSARTA